MTRYLYRAIDRSGAMRKGAVDVPSEMAVIEKLNGEGYVPITVRKAPAGLWEALETPLFSSARLSGGDIAHITEELANLLAADLTLERSLELLIELADNRTQRSILNRVLERVREGRSLADALAEERRVFSPSYVSMIRAGETSGTLVPVMARLAEYLKNAQQVRDRIHSALVYPAILLITIIATMVLVVGFVLPQFEPLFASAGVELPMATRIVIAMSHLFTDRWPILLALAIAAGFGAWRALRQPKTRRAIDVMLLSRRFLSGLPGKVDMARFSRMLGTLLKNGVALPAALSLTAATLSNAILKEAVDNTTARLKEGGSLATMLARTGAFPRMVLRLVQIGEETGRLADMLLQSAEVLDRDVQTVVDRLLAALVPLVTVIMGALVAIVIGSVLVGVMTINQLAY